MTGTREKLGRTFVAISLVVFGVQHFIYGGFVATLVPAFMPGRLFWAYFVGVAFVAAAIGILTKMLARPAATMLGVMFFLFVLLLHIPRVIGNSKDGNEWTSGFVALAMCGGAWILASAAPLEAHEKADPFLRLGRYFFALAFLAFGIQHFVFGRYAAGLGPPWIPGQPLLAYLFGIIFVAAGAAIVIGKMYELAATILAAIAFLYFVLLYVPRIIGQLHNPGPWTSGFEILALCGGALVLAGSIPKEENART
ncbi:MAG TPA: hypothetical protein VJO16_13900 [Candidatus Acidoferrum sp.]|nr:hypothetical protein [Candidatus Acidoferrum sp.]